MTDFKCRTSEPSRQQQIHRMAKPNITAEILTIGDEILYGQIVDTNSQWMSEKLDEIGVRVIRKTTVGDNEQDILDAFAQSEKRADITLITGGLGPTNDDLTKPLLAKYFDSPLVLHQEALDEIADLFQRKGRELTELNRKQAELPEICSKITNKYGTAPGMWFERDASVFVSMPGVPFEMKHMMEDTILPKIRETFKTPVIYHKVVKTAGIGESWLADLIKEWEADLPEHIKLAYLPSKGQVRLRLTAFGDDLTELQTDVEKKVVELLMLAGQYVYGFDNTSLEQAVGEILAEKNLSIGTAESCTGGRVANMITAVPGSSKYFTGSVVAYHNDIKTKYLKVSQSNLDQHGAVSEQVVSEMAENVKSVLSTDVGVATSGIAGPDGGSDEKPVGTIWIAVSTKAGVKTKKLQLTNKRDLNIELTAIALLNLLRQELIGLN